MKKMQLEQSQFLAKTALVALLSLPFQGHSAAFGQSLTPLIETPDPETEEQEPSEECNPNLDFSCIPNRKDDGPIKFPDGITAPESSLITPEGLNINPFRDFGFN